MHLSSLYAFEGQRYPKSVDVDAGSIGILESREVFVLHVRRSECTVNRRLELRVREEYR